MRPARPPRLTQLPTHCALLLLAETLGAGAAQAATPVFINEFHYDNAGTDANEFIEIAGPGGTDLTGWQVLRYNGASSSLKVYTTPGVTGPLPAGIPGAPGTVGVVTVAYAVDGLQNGAPDGFALVNGAGAVVQFLSYEGAFTAADGPALGLTSTDLGVLENSAPAGTSLQLAGSGTAYEDFHWTAGGTATPGAVNTGQTFASGPTDTTPPALAGSSPSAGATGVALGVGAVTIDFSEPVVDAALAGATVACPAGGTAVRSGAATIAGARVTLPVTTLPVGTTCAVTLPAGAVKDAADNPSAALGFNFSTDAPVVSRTLPFSEDFSACTMTDWALVSVDADAAHTWYCSGGTAQANGFGDTAAANDWLILPPVDLNAQTDERLSFTSWTRFTDSGVAHPQLRVLYSTDYDGSGNPAHGTWVPLTGVAFSPSNSQTWTGSGATDLSAIAGNRVYFAFQYRSSGTATGAAAQWQIDDLRIGPDVPPVSECGQPATLISAIQGHPGTANWPQTPVLGATETVEAIVTAAFPGTTGMQGFFIQEADGQADGNPQTSEGLFVYDPAGAGGTLQPGDRVRVAGFVAEYNGKTQLSSLSRVELCSIGNPLPTAVSLHLPEAVDGDLEFAENMRVSIPEPMLVSQTYFLGRYGQLSLASQDDAAYLTRPYQPTHRFDPASPEALALADENARRLLILDDGFEVSSLGDNPATVPYLGAAPDHRVIRSGDRVTGLVGILDQGRIDSGSPATVDYRLQPTAAPVFIGDNARTAEPDAVGGRLRVASFNVLNYFNGNGSGLDGTAGGFPTARGATTLSELNRQSVKIAAAVCAMGADVLGLLEIENDGGEIASALTELTDRVNAQADCAAAQLSYAAVHAGTFGTDEIATALIYNPAKVAAVGAPAILEAPGFVDPAGSGVDKNRPALAQTFRELASGKTFTVVINHLKSKGSACGSGDDDPVYALGGTNQGNCNLTRRLAAQALRDWLATDPTGSGDTNYLIIGDLNSYALEDPIRALEDPRRSGPAFINLVRHRLGDDAYSYVFNGQSGYLDHALASTALLGQVAGVGAWHINADEPEVINYSEQFNPPNYYDPDPYRSSDHDPVLVGLSLAVPGDLTGNLAVDLDDLNALKPSFGKPASAAPAGADLDGDGRITVLDYRRLVLLCTKPGCAR